MNLTASQTKNKIHLEMLFEQIMLIDDNPIETQANTKIIETTRLGKEITILHSGLQAIIELKIRITSNEKFPQLIFLDLSMPDMTGLEFLDEFAKLPEEKIKSVRIVVLTSSIEKKDFDNATASPYVIKFLAKPLTREKILAIPFLEII